MKKVIEVVPTMSTGGAEAMVKDYALLMDREKITMKVVVLDHRYSSENERLLDENNIETFYLNGILYGNREDLNVFQKIRRSVSRYYYFRKFLLREKPDVIHIHLKLGWYFKMLPLKKMNVKLIYTVHNVIENYFDKKPGLRSKYFEYREANRLIHRYGMTLVALHDEMNEQLRNFFRTERVITVNNGIIMERFDPSKYDREAVRKELLVGEDEFLIGHVGRLHPQKNHDLILEVFCEVLKIKPQAKLLLIGKGELKEEIKKRFRIKGLKTV